MTKRDLRKKYRAMRMEMPVKKFAESERKVIDRLLQLPDLGQGTSVHTYLPLRKRREIDTWPIIETLWKQNKRVRVPALSRNMPEMECIELESGDELELAQWGLEEPVVKRRAPPENLDVAIVPLLCFDVHGHRVGYGKGYYDRFFEKATRCTRIGLSLFGPETPIDDIDEMDVPLHMCVTPERVYVF